MLILYLLTYDALSDFLHEVDSSITLWVMIILIALHVKHHENKRIKMLVLKRVIAQKSIIFNKFFAHVFIFALNVCILFNIKCANKCI